MAADPQPGVIEALGAMLSKWWPTLLGALLSVRFQAAESTRLDRATAAASGVAISMVASPAIVDFAGVASVHVAQGIAGATALFGLVVVGELIAGIKGLELGRLLHDWIRSILRIPR